MYYGPNSIYFHCYEIIISSIIIDGINFLIFTVDGQWSIAKIKLKLTRQLHFCIPSNRGQYDKVRFVVNLPKDWDYDKELGR